MKSLGKQEELSDDKRIVVHSLLLAILVYMKAHEELVLNWLKSTVRCERQSSESRGNELRTTLWLHKIYIYIYMLSVGVRYVRRRYMGTAVGSRKRAEISIDALRRLSKTGFATIKRIIELWKRWWSSTCEIILQRTNEAKQFETRKIEKTDNRFEAEKCVFRRFRLCVVRMFMLRPRCGGAILIAATE